MQAEETIVTELDMDIPSMNVSYGRLRSDNTSANVSTLEQHFNPDLLASVVSALNLFGIPAVIVIGILGNALTFLTLTCTYLRYQSSSVYLGFLSAVDAGFLLCLIQKWLRYLGMSALERAGWCQLVPYLSNVCGFLSVWTVVGFTFERYLVVFHPLQRHRFCTRRRAAYVLLSLTLVALPAYVISGWTYTVMEWHHTMMCVPKFKYRTHINVFLKIDTVVKMVIPALLVLGINAAISIKICDFLKRRRHLLPASAVCDPDGVKLTTPSYDRWRMHDRHMLGSRRKWHAVTSLASDGGRTISRVTQLLRRSLGTRSHRSYSRGNFQMRTTRSMLIVSSTFIVLNLPSHAFRVYTFFLTIQDDDLAFPLSVTALQWQQILLFLYYVNFASNFLIYSVSSRSFRLAVKRLVKFCTYKLRQCCRASVQGHHAERSTVLASKRGYRANQRMSMLNSL